MTDHAKALADAMSEILSGMTAKAWDRGNGALTAYLEDTEGGKRTMRERVAMAIAASMENDTRTVSEKWKFFLPQAAAALQEMRVPTESMENVAYASKFFREGTQPGSLDWRPDLIFTAMIDEALK